LDIAGVNGTTKKQVDQATELVTTAKLSEVLKSDSAHLQTIIIVQNQHYYLSSHYFSFIITADLSIKREGQSLVNYYRIEVQAAEFDGN